MRPLILISFFFLLRVRGQRQIALHGWNWKVEVSAAESVSRRWKPKFGFLVHKFVRCNAIKPFAALSQGWTFMLCCSSRSWHSGFIANILALQAWTVEKVIHGNSISACQEENFTAPEEWGTLSGIVSQLSNIYGMFTFEILLRLWTCRVGKGSTAEKGKKWDIIRQ